MWEDPNALMTLAGIALKPLLCAIDLLQRKIQIILISKSYYVSFTQTIMLKHLWRDSLIKVHSTKKRP